jgi:hypothetical protein
MLTVHICGDKLDVNRLKYEISQAADRFGAEEIHFEREDDKELDEA